MKSLLSALCILIFTLLSCQKEVVKPLEDDSIQTASRTIGPEDQPEPNYITLFTVVMKSGFVYDFSATWKIGLNFGNGGGSYNLGSVHTGVHGGGTQHGWTQDIVYWGNQPGSPVITFIIKAKHSYWALMPYMIDHVQDDVIIEGWYDCVAKGGSLTAHVVGQHIIK